MRFAKTATIAAILGLTVTPAQAGRRARRRRMFPLRKPRHRRRALRSRRKLLRLSTRLHPNRRKHRRLARSRRQRRPLRRPRLRPRRAAPSSRRPRSTSRLALSAQSWRRTPRCARRWSRAWPPPGIAARSIRPHTALRIRASSLPPRTCREISACRSISSSSR